jgi:hypothetical protein
MQFGRSRNRHDPRLAPTRAQFVRASLSFARRIFLSNRLTPDSLCRALGRKARDSITKIRIHEIISCLSFAGPNPKLIPMQPNPRAETSNPLFPNFLFCIFSPLVPFGSQFAVPIAGGYSHVHKDVGYSSCQNRHHRNADGPTSYGRFGTFGVYMRYGCRVPPSAPLVSY